MTDNNIIAVNYQPASIAGDFEKLKDEVRSYIAKYASFNPAAATEENESDLRKARADLNARKKDLDDRRKEIKRAYNEPLAAFEASVKEVTAIYDETIVRFDQALNDIKDARTKARIELLKETFEGSAGLLVGLTDPETFWIREPKLLNKATSDKKAENMMLDMIEQLAKDQATLESLNLPFEVEAEAVLFKTLDLQSALDENKALVERKKRDEENAARIAEMKQAQREIAGETTESNLPPDIAQTPTTTSKQEPKRYSAVTFIYKDVTDEQIAMICQFCKQNGIHGTMRK